MEIVEKNKYITLFLDREMNRLEGFWNDNADNITNNEIKGITTIISDIIKRYAPKHFLADDSNRKFIYSVDMQEWVALSYAEACIKAGVQKFAIIMPDDLIAQLSTEQTRDEAGELPFEIEYFDNKQNALSWLEK